MSEESLVLVEVRGGLGVITLNRPRAVNALNYEMLKSVDGALTDFESNEGVHAVLIRGAGERGLCAGGDVVSLYRAIEEENFAFAEDYFRVEYTLNHRIAHYPKPYIALMDGLVLGGGIGASAHGSHRIVTENTKAGMPETVIGFSPDIGGLNILARAPHHFGTAMALTGIHVGAADALAVGLADYFIPVERLDELQEALTQVSGAEQVTRTIEQFTQDAGASAFEENKEWIEAAFSKENPQQIADTLKKAAQGESSSLAEELYASILRNSPTGVKTALKAIRRAEGQSLAQTLEQDYLTSCNALRAHDMREGIRAQVVDKDRNPVWEPASFDEVSDELVESFFAPLNEDEDLKL
ncbi:enoyl-CoA hydratase/isomerase family protein [Rothia sp. ZJ932]|uniref:enoyl-CoA hydratase/isomerase family protein n=1 Tax=Rothia sp. ZJ932 TaxID=2810516 RepID=UPI0019670C86|nr:enoyl-CoA hydratase/isomerase family protein [Rothia sp. ZJ932]QRZ61686.1 enoyl-CoA hydratase/isomerase family protein [Rothia sp. ZJ932]